MKKRFIPETIDAPAYFRSNTGYRFISKGKTAFKISIPKPQGGYVYKTVGYVRKGEAVVLPRVIMLRNQLGKDVWGKHWHRVVSNFTLLARLPRNVEPVFQLASDRICLTAEYRANWIVYKDGKQVKVSRRYSCEKHGKLVAYMLAKKALLAAHSDVMELLQFMGRAPIANLR